jgi:hypothetical protein
MTTSAWIAFASLLITMVGGFAATMIKLGGVMQRLDLLWSWYLAEVGPGIPGGRRRTDPAAMATADDSDESSSDNGAAV